MNFSTAFGQALVNTRRKRGLTQAQLAKSADIHINTLSFIERGQTSATLDSIAAIADAMGMLPSELLSTAERILFADSGQDQNQGKVATPMPKPIDPDAGPSIK